MSCVACLLDKVRDTSPYHDETSEMVTYSRVTDAKFVSSLRASVLKISNPKPH